MADWRCPHCSGPLSTRVFSPEMETICPHCGRPFEAPVDAEAQEVAVEIVDSEGGGGRPAHGRRSRRGAREMVVFLEGGNGAGCGCGALGCLLIVFLLFLILRGCGTLF